MGSALRVLLGLPGVEDVVEMVRVRGMRAASAELSLGLDSLVLSGVLPEALLSGVRFVVSAPTRLLVKAEAVALVRSPGLSFLYSATRVNQRG